MPQSALKASATYKKQNGTLSLSEDKRNIIWTPATPNAPPAFKISASDITNLQQSPATSAKASLKVIVQPQGAAVAENHVFTLTSATAARAELAAILDPLKEVIAAQKAVTRPAAPNAAAGTADGGVSASMAIAQAVSAGARATDDDQYSDARLLSNHNLQKSLLGANAVLRQRFNESLKGKPEAITLPQFSAQFWSTRVHLLRAHAVEKSQHQGSYNVLSEVKLTIVDEKHHLSLNREQIQLIFGQHPLLRRAYDDLVPRRLSETDFWAKFAVSRLFKQLKGEKITEDNPPIKYLDDYLDYNEKALQSQQFIMGRVPRFMDIEGNEQNHSKRLGNAPDTTMRPSSHDKVPILRTLNNMSEKMMYNVAPSDAETHGPVGLDEETFNELQLRDLQRLDKDNRVLLNITNQEHFSSTDNPGRLTTNGRINGDKALRDVRKEILSGLQLPTDLDEDNEEQAGNATSNIMKSVKQRVLTSSQNAGSDTRLSSSVVSSAIMTHNTTIEFLHYFWTVYLSGDESRAIELSKLAETLDKSLERVEAVAAQAETEREKKISDLEEQHRRYYETTKRRRKMDLSKVGGGRQAIRDMLVATIRAVEFASAEYKRMYKEQSAQQGQL